MILTTKQQEGLRIAVERYRNHEKYTVISGFAGSGKSTLVRFIIDALNVPETSVCYTSFTGKAADVLRQKGCLNAMTLHKLLFESVPLPRGGFLRKRKENINYRIVVVDEISMVPKSLLDVLATHHCYILCCGDPFQIPPIQKDEDNHLLDRPHIFLDEIMRQALDSEIIRLSMKIRNSEIVDPKEYEHDVKILKENDLNTGMLLWADQILVGTNDRRKAINNQMRQLLGRGDAPEDGDKVICAKNYWETFSDDGNPLVNGTIGYLKNPFKTNRHIPRPLNCSVSKIEVLCGGLVTESGDCYESLEMDNHMILTEEKCVDWSTAYKLNRAKYKYGEIVPKEFTYGYAITTHRAQGSEWSKVLVIEERFPFDKQEHARWLYTSVTRSSSKLVLIQK